MTKVITYGTFDLFHRGHLNILRKAKELGDYLVVGVTSEQYDIDRGKLNVCQSLSERIENIRATGLADEIIVEEYVGQKIKDIKELGIDKFVIGSDWLGKFDYLKEYCEVIYTKRTQGVSSTELRVENNPIIKLGVLGNGRIAKRFVQESKYVSGIDINVVCGRNRGRVEDFCRDLDINSCKTLDELDEFFSSIDAVYIALPHSLHYQYAKKALLAGKHVLCEKPFTLKESQTRELLDLAEKNQLIIQEAIKTAYAPCFERLVHVAKSGVIGEITQVEAPFTRLTLNNGLREFDSQLGGGSLSEFGSYPLCLFAKLLGTEPKDVLYTTQFDHKKDVDVFTNVELIYPSAIASATLALEAKKENCCVITGTRGYIFVPAPWWKTEYFEIKFENLNETQKVFCKFEGDGLRYEIADFVKSINGNRLSKKILKEEMVFISKIIDDFYQKIGTSERKGIRFLI